MDKKISVSAYLFFASAFTFLSAEIISALSMTDINLFVQPSFIIDFVYNLLVRAGIGGLILFFLNRLKNERANIKVVKPVLYISFIFFAVCIYVSVFLFFISFMKSLFYLSDSIDFYIWKTFNNFNFIPMNDLFSSIWEIPKTINYISYGSPSENYVPYIFLIFLNNAFFFSGSILFIGATGKIYRELQDKDSSQEAGYSAAGASGENVAAPAKMTFGRAISQCFYKNFYFEGTAGRAEYWWFYLFTNGIKFLLVLACFFSAITWHEILLMFLFAVFALFSVITLLPGISVAVRRAHDAGFMGLFAFLPLFNFVTMLFPTDENSIYRDGRCRHPKLKALAKFFIVVSLITFIVYSFIIEKDLFVGNYFFRMF